ncbi:CD3e molecule, epsilon associated protein [Hippoglossus hippoglossus]|uniref:CD3e molecule, epsilon associated protein n=1 Tax=Hippoglossus hippoglossus TaxID=8267 RepID=UPI00148E0805|nr:CD3e molecule, epsilon associated protein [Hippoglossus hippoglossus]XP_035009819.2 CD3e molecule, epsilon associated protein [Hippoglossus stenolepis]
MPKVVSSSSSEEEEEPRAAGTQHKPQEKKKKTRYQCPADFVSFCHAPCSSTRTESLSNNKNELWLIKAPANFDPECFSGIKVPLSGLETVKVPTAAGGATTASGQKIYSILASSHGTSELHLLTTDKQSSDGVAFAPAFSGLINVCESYGNTSANWAPQVIPAAPAPSIPPGLKQRFQPFGSRTPTLTCVAENETDGAAFGPSSTTLRPLVVKRYIEEAGNEEEGEGRRKKKKKKKEKQIKLEREESEELVKVELEAEIKDEVMTELPEEKRKKKKKKKDREREEVEEGVEPSVEVKAEEVTVKCEPMDTSYGDEGEGLVKKKKKKKKSKTDDD